MRLTRSQIEDTINDIERLVKKSRLNGLHMMGKDKEDEMIIDMLAMMYYLDRKRKSDGKE